MGSWRDEGRWVDRNLDGIVSWVFSFTVGTFGAAVMFGVVYSIGYALGFR